MTIHVFDAYGTLFDVHSAVARLADRIGPQAGALSAMWRERQLQYTWVYALADRYVPFDILTERALDFAVETTKAPVDSALRAELLGAYRVLDAYPEVGSALDALADRGECAAILSNGTPEMLDAATWSAGLREKFSAILSADSLKTYKTDARVYELVTGTFGVAREDVQFYSSNRWDVAGATWFGFKVNWVNRLGVPDEYPDGTPVRVITSLENI